MVDGITRVLFRLFSTISFMDILTMPIGIDDTLSALTTFTINCINLLKNDPDSAYINVISDLISVWSRICMHETNLIVVSTSQHEEVYSKLKGYTNEVLRVYIDAKLEMAVNDVDGNEMTSSSPSDYENDTDLLKNIGILSRIDCMSILPYYTNLLIKAVQSLGNAQDKSTGTLS